jgi:hypothetical protein
MPPVVRYPFGIDYREALFDTRRCFRDPALVGGDVALDELGMPKANSGTFASVFTVQGRDSRRWAVKCFTRYVDHHTTRYQRISDALKKNVKPWRVEFEYLEEGIFCKGSWYPALKMEWIDASELIPFVERHLGEPQVLAHLANRFAEMLVDLSACGIAHGDLQHGNLLVTPSGDLKLIDYDGMFVPALAQIGACEIGHRHYQSPARTMSTWGSYLDNFSAWVIYGSLVALTIDPLLWSLLHKQGDDALLFHQDDYVDPRGSRALLTLAQSSRSELQAVGRLMSGLWTPRVPSIPPLNPDELPEPNKQTLSVGVPPLLAHGPTDARVSEWITHAQPASRGPGAGVSGGASWVTGHLTPLPPVTFTPPRLSIRLLAYGGLAAIVAAGLVARFGLLPSVAAVGASVLVVLMFVAITGVLFRRTPEWQDKRVKSLILRERRASASKAARELAKLEGLRLDIDSRERKVVEKLAKQTDQARSSEQKEIAGADHKLADQIQALQRQRASLDTSEEREKLMALRSLQDQHVNSHLASASIKSASISGIGAGIVGSLANRGVRTAADFTGYAMEDAPRGGRRAVIRLRMGGKVHISGVGEKKAQALVNWRQGIERRARATQPSSLPATQAGSIKDRYISRHRSFADAEKAATGKAANEKRQIRQKWAQTRAAISAELVSARQGFVQEKAQADAQLSAAQNREGTVSWQRDIAAREAAAYRGVTYRRYLSGVVKSLR